MATEKEREANDVEANGWYRRWAVEAGRLMRTRCSVWERKVRRLTWVLLWDKTKTHRTWMMEMMKSRRCQPQDMLRHRQFSIKQHPNATVSVILQSIVITVMWQMWCGRCSVIRLTSQFPTTKWGVWRNSLPSRLSYRKEDSCCLATWPKWTRQLMPGGFWLVSIRAIGVGQLGAPTPPGWPLWRATYLCTILPSTMR